MMDIRALHYFRTVAEFGSYSRGAEFLRISQPAVSRQIRKLEEDLGRPLFRRTGHGVALTEAGEMLQERAQVLFRGLEQARAEIRSSRPGLTGTVSLAIPSGAGQWLLPPLVARFRARHPEVSLRVLGGFSGTLHEWLVRGRADIACVHDPLPQRGFRILPLAEEEVCLVGRPGSAALRKGHVLPADLARLPLILSSRANASRRLLDAWLEGTAPPETRIEVNDHAMLRALLRSGAGFAMLTRGGFAAEAERGELEGVPFRPRVAWTLSLVTAEDPARADILEPLIETMREVAQELAATGWPVRPLAAD
jgi:LysR family nitrogen assimilation transcriptional regulator